jgi:HPt (histidine-containing phosphotransfer) domain-containing protein
MAVVKAAVVDGDAPAMGRAAHSLKGSASAVGAVRLAAICVEFEMLARDTALAGAPDLVIALDDEFVRVTEAFQPELRPGPRT